MQNKMKKVTVLMVVLGVFVLGCMSTVFGASKKKIEESDTEDRVSNVKTSNASKAKVYVDFKEKGNWKSDKKDFTQYEMSIYNDSKKEIKDWCVYLKKKDSKIEQNWNASIKDNGDKYEVTPVEYNKKIPNEGSQKGIGIIASSTSNDTLELESTTIYYSDGTYERNN